MTEKGHRCGACYDTPGWVVSPNVGAFVHGSGLGLYDAELVPAEAKHVARLMRPCPNRTDARAVAFHRGEKYEAAS